MPCMTYPPASQYVLATIKRESRNVNLFNYSRTYVPKGTPNEYAEIGNLSEWRIRLYAQRLIGLAMLLLYLLPSLE